MINPSVIAEIQQLQKLIFKPMILTQMHLVSADYTFQLESFNWNTHVINESPLFVTITDYENNLLNIERQKMRIRNQLNGGSSNIKVTTKLQKPFEMYKNKVQFITIDCT
jgi:hypothetical protein